MADEEIEPATKVMRMVIIGLLSVTVIAGGFSAIFGIWSNDSHDRQSDEVREENPFE